MDSIVEMYERFADLCRAQVRCLAGDDLAEMERLLAEKDALLACIAAHQPWLAADIPEAVRERSLAAARAAEAAHQDAVAALAGRRAAVQVRLRQARGGRLAMQGYRPSGQPSPLVESYG